MEMEMATSIHKVMPIQRLLIVFLAFLPILANGQASQPWWQIFKDSEMDALVQTALASNGTVKAGQSRVQVAMLQKQAIAAYYIPNLSLDPLVQQQSLAPNRPLPINAVGTRFTLNSINLPLSANYDLNFWLKKTQVQQATNTIWQQSMQLSQTQLALSAQVVQAIIDARTADWTLAVLDRNISLLDSVQRIVEARFKAGLTNELALSLNRTQRETLEIDKENAKGQRVAALAQLSGVIGGGAVRLSPNAAPGLLPTIDTSAMGEALQQRPDVRLFQYQLEAGQLTYKQLNQSRLPRPFVAAATGQIAQQPDKLLSNNSFTYTLAAGISIPILDWRNNRYHGRAAKEEIVARQALLTQQLANANSAARTAQANILRSGRQLAAADRSLNTAQRTLQLSKELFTRGLSTFLDVLTAQQSLISLQSRKAALQGQYLQSVADYQLARGGR